MLHNYITPLYNDYGYYIGEGENNYGSYKGYAYYRHS